MTLRKFLPNVEMSLSESDLYRTIIKPSEEVLYKEKNSKFFSYAFPVNSEEDVKGHIEALKKQHHAARHWCYAYQLGLEEHELIYRANDDGEPSNSAGIPIYGQIQSFELTNVLIVVVRYFGGVKLGVGGLISAYRTAAQMALGKSEIIQKTIDLNLSLKFDYTLLNIVMRVIKEENLNIATQEMQMNCKLVLTVRKNDLQKIKNRFENIYGVDVEIIP